MTSCWVGGRVGGRVKGEHPGGLFRAGSHLEATWSGLLPQERFPCRASQGTQIIRSGDDSTSGHFRSGRSKANGRG